MCEVMCGCSFKCKNLETVSGEKGGKRGEAGRCVPRRRAGQTRAGRRAPALAAGARPARMVFNSDEIIAFCQL